MEKDYSTTWILDKRPRHKYEIRFVREVAQPFRRSEGKEAFQGPDWRPKPASAWTGF